MTFIKIPQDEVNFMLVPIDTVAFQCQQVILGQWEVHMAFDGETWHLGNTHDENGIAGVIKDYTVSL